MCPLTKWLKGDYIEHILSVQHTINDGTYTVKSLKYLQYLHLHLDFDIVGQ